MSNDLWMVLWIGTAFAPPAPARRTSLGPLARFLLRRKNRRSAAADASSAGSGSTASLPTPGAAAVPERLSPRHAA